jgi:hypothetical protein
VQLGRFIIKNNCEESYCNLQNVFAVATKEWRVSRSEPLSIS